MLRFAHGVAHISTSFAHVTKSMPCMATAHFVCPSVSWCTCGMFPVWGCLPLWTWVWRFLCGPLFSVLLGAYLRAKLLVHVVTLRVALWETANCSLKGLYTLHSQQRCTRALVFPHRHQYLLANSLMIALLVGMKWYLTVVCICISLVQRWTSLHVLIGHLHICFEEMSVQSFAYF